MVVSQLSSTIGGAMLLLSWLTTIGALYGGGGLALVYALADVVTVVIVLSTVSHSRRVNPSLLVVALGLLCGTIGDLLYATLSPLPIGSVINAIDAVWLSAYLLVG